MWKAQRRNARADLILDFFPRKRNQNDGTMVHTHEYRMRFSSEFNSYALFCNAIKMAR